MAALKRGADPAVPGRVRERGSATVAILAGALILLFVGSLYVLVVTPRPERARPIRDARPTAAQRSVAEMDEAAQSATYSALAAATAVYADLGSFDEASPALLGMIEPSLSYTTGESSGDAVASVAGTGRTYGVAVRSASGTCWWLRVEGKGHTASFGSGEACTAADALAGADRTAW